MRCRHLKCFFSFILVGSELDQEINGGIGMILSNSVRRRIKEKKMPKLPGEEKVIIIFTYTTLAHQCDLSSFSNIRNPR